jgi:hypothetical protein
MFDAAAREVPAGSIAVANEKDARIFIDDEALNSQRHEIGALRQL